MFTVNRKTRHTPCKITIESDNKLLYIVDNVSIKENILKKMELEYQIDDRSWVGSAQNNVIYGLSNGNFVDASFSSFCTVSQEFIDAMKMEYTDFFKQVMNKQSEEIKYFTDMGLCYSSDNCVILPDINIYWPVSENDIYDCVFNVFPLGNADYFKSSCHLANAQQKSIDDAPLLHFKRVIADIYKFTASKGIDEREVRIDIQDIHSNNKWINIKFCLRKIFSGEYYYVRLTALHRTLSVESFINFLENKQSIDGMIKRTFNNSDIKKYGIERFCYMVPNKIKQWKPLRKINTKTPKPDLKQFIICGSYKSKISKYSTLCSITLCCKYNNEYHAVNIIPYTIDYIMQTDDVNKYINDYEPIKKFTYKENEMMLVNKKDLKYIVEVTPLGCYDCENDKVKCTLSDEAKRYQNFMERTVYFYYTGNEKLFELQVSDYHNNNFYLIPSIVLFRIIYCAIKLFRTTDKKQQIKELMKKLENAAIEYHDSETNLENKKTLKFYLGGCHHDKYYNANKYDDYLCVCKIFVDTNLPYLMVPGTDIALECIKNGEASIKDEKYVVWYIHSHDNVSIKNLELSVDLFIKNISKNKKFEWEEINTIHGENVENNYVYDVLCLCKYGLKHTIDKFVTFIDTIFNFYNLKFFHIRNLPGLRNLHMHVVFRNYMPDSHKMNFSRGTYVYDDKKSFTIENYRMQNTFYEDLNENIFKKYTIVKPCKIKDIVEGDYKSLCREKFGIVSDEYFDYLWEINGESITAFINSVIKKQFYLLP